MLSLEIMNLNPFQQEAMANIKILRYGNDLIMCGAQLTSEKYKQLRKQLPPVIVTNIIGWISCHK